MNKNYYTKTKKNINGYYALLNSAIDKVEQAIDHISWGMSCETLDDLRDSLLKDFLDGVLIDIK